MPSTIRLATEQDASHIRAIYTPHVSDSAASFETEPPTVDEMRQRIVQTLERLPWLVCERDAEVLGYAYASRHRTRAAYDWSVDVSVYVHDQVQRRGVGRALYTSLFSLLKLQGFCNAYAGVTLPNPASVALHESLGFQPIGVYRNVGYKLGAWHDVGWWQFALRDHAVPAEPPADLPTVRSSPAWEPSIGSGVASLRI